jgi:FkbM family methyltransferase
MSDQSVCGGMSHILVSRALRLALEPLRRALVAVPILRGPLRGTRWIVAAGIHRCWLGSYEQEKLHLFARMLRPGSIVFDVGAHAGLYSLLAANRVGSDGHVYAFEPLPQNIDFLNKHLRLNALNNVTVISAAVSDSSGIRHFKQAVDGYVGRLDDLGELCVSTVRLDDLYMNRQILCPDLVKIDVEGAEYAVLQGAKDLLVRAHPTVFLAIHGKACRDDCVALLRWLGYSLSPLDATALDEATEIIAFGGHNTIEPISESIGSG